MLINFACQGVATTLITAKINITSMIGSRKELIDEVFAPWRSRSSPNNVPDGQDMTISDFRAARITNINQGLSVNSKAEDLANADESQNVELKESDSLR